MCWCVCRILGPVIKLWISASVPHKHSQIKYILFEVYFSFYGYLMFTTGAFNPFRLMLSLVILCIFPFQVDLLGDEVDALLRLLEKIYIALDHYSPVLKHYPGVSRICLPGMSLITSSSDVLIKNDCSRKHHFSTPSWLFYDVNKLNIW